MQSDIRIAFSRGQRPFEVAEDIVEIEFRFEILIAHGYEPGQSFSTEIAGSLYAR